MSGRAKWVELGVALVVGAAAAAVLWAAGGRDVMWLGFVATGLAYAGGSRRCRDRISPARAD